MSFPYDAGTELAIGRLGSYYNGNNYNAGSNPGGMGGGGHRVNFIPSLNDEATVGSSVSDAAVAASASATAAAASAVTSASQSSALSGTSVTSVAIGSGSKAFTTQSGKSFDVGSFVLIASAASPTTHYMIGQVTAYAGTALTVNVTDLGAGTGTRADWTIYGRIGRTGSTGPTGATGLQGSTASLRWLFSTATADADPGSGLLRFNNATYASVTQLYFDNNDANGVAQTTWLAQFDDSTNTALRGTLSFMQIDAPTTYAVYNVTAANVDGTGYQKITVSHVMSSGTFVAGHEIAVEFSRTGDKGTDGAGAGDTLSDIAVVVDGRLVKYNGTTGKHISDSGFVIGTSGTAIGALSTANTWAGVQTFAGVNMDSFLAWSADITPTQITANQDNYAPTGNATAIVFRLSTDASRNITGISGGTDGRIIMLVNVGNFDIVLLNDVTSTAANRFLIGADFTLAAGQQLMLIYDNTAQRWKPVGAIGLGPNGSATRPTYSFSSDPDSGWYRIGANNVGTAVNGAKVLDVATTGLAVTGTLSSSGAASGPTAAVDTDTTQLATTAFVNAQISAQLLRTPLMNVGGGMKTAQETPFGNSLSGTSGSGRYITDMMFLSIAGATTAVCVTQQHTDAPVGYSNCAQVTVTTADVTLAASEFVALYYGVELGSVQRLMMGTANAKSFSAAFWIRGKRTGQYTLSVNNGMYLREYSTTFTINSADTWEYKTFTLPGDTVATGWNDASVAGQAELAFFIILASGPTNTGSATGAWRTYTGFGATGQTNGVAALTDYFQVTGFIVLPGLTLPNSTYAPLLMPTLAEEIDSCQRYYEKSWNMGSKVPTVITTGIEASIAPGTSALWTVPYKVRKSRAGSVAIYSPSTGAGGNFQDVTGAVDRAATVLGATERNYWLSTPGHADNAQIRWHWAANARL